jgi:serine/threonine protein phosphatase 1
MFSWLQTRRKRTYPPAAEGVTLYVIGDIHGRADCLATVHALIDRDIALRGNGDQTVEIYIGDYVDRGPDSRGVINLLVQRIKTASVVLLRGNHETVMESFLRGLTPFDDWRSIGGVETILSYGVDVRMLLATRGTIDPRDLAQRLPATHIRFFSSLRSFYLCGPYCFVHAGMRPNIPIESQSVEDLTWIRDDFLNFSGDFGHIVVHGHTPVSTIDFLSNRVNIDTGAYATNRLSVIRIDSKGLSVVEEVPR